MKIRLGIVGLGGFFNKKHLPAILKLQDQFEIRCVYTSSREKFAKLHAQIPGAKHCEDPAALLAQDDVDAVVACVPIPRQFEIARQVLLARKHLLAEKPLAATLAQGRALLAMAKRKGVQFMIAENFRYVSVFHQVKRILNDGALGKIRLVQINTLLKLDEASPYYARWRFDPKGYGGILLDGGIHIISLLRFLLGTLKLRYRHLASVNPHLGKHDTAILHLESSAKVAIDAVISYSIFNRDDFFLRIYGSEGSLKCNMSTLILEGVTSKAEHAFPSHEYMDIYTDFFNAVTQKKKPAYDIREAYADLAAFDTVFNTKPK